MEDLRTLIEELEKEKAALNQLIDQAVKEQEFLSAHFHAEALELLNIRLRTLGNLEDELYDQKYFIRTGIENLKKRLNEEADDHLRKALSQLVSDKEKQLVELNKTPTKQKSNNSQSHLREYLDELTRNKIKGLRVILNTDLNIAIEIRRTKGGAKLTMAPLKKLHAEHTLTGDRLLKLKGLGFFFNEKSDKATAIISANKKALSDKVMTFISIIVFEVFRFKALDKKAAIEILSKTNLRTGN